MYCFTIVSSQGIKKFKPRPQNRAFAPIRCSFQNIQRASLSFIFGSIVHKTGSLRLLGIFSKYPTSNPVLYSWEYPGGFNWIQPLVSCVTSGILNRLKPRTQGFHHIAVSRGPKRVISCRYWGNPSGHPCQKERAIVQHLTKSPLRTRIYFVRVGMYYLRKSPCQEKYGSRKQDETGNFGRHFFSRLHADVRESNILSREFKLAWVEVCSKNKKIRAKVVS